MMIQRRVCRALALGMIVMLTVAALAGCARQSSVSVQVVSARSGAGIPGATMTFGGGSDVLTADSKGAVTGKVAASETQVTVEAAGYQKASLTVADPAQLPTTVKLTPSFLITGVVSTAGQPVAGATVTIWNKTVTTAADGSFALEGLASGSYTGRVSKQGFADATFEVASGSTAPVQVTLQEGQLLPLTSPATLPAYQLTASYQRTLKGEDKAFSGTVVKNGDDVLVLTGSAANPADALMVRGGTGYVLQNGSYVPKGATAAAAAQVLQHACEDLLMLPATFSGRTFTMQKQDGTVALLGQECAVYDLSGTTVYERQNVKATATVTVGTSGALANVPVKIVLHASNTAFFDFTYDATVALTSIDQGQAAAAFPAQ